MAYNFNNPYSFPWSSTFPNGFNAPHPAGTPRPPPGFSPDLYSSGRFPGIFPYGMPFQSGDHNSQFQGPDWNFPYQNNLNQFGPIHQNTSASGPIQGSDTRNFHHVASDSIHPLNVGQSSSFINAKHSKLCSK